MKLDRGDYVGDITPHANFRNSNPKGAVLHMREIVIIRVYFLHPLLFYSLRTRRDRTVWTIFVLYALCCCCCCCCISNPIITTNRIPNRKFDSKSNRISKLCRSLLIVANWWNDVQTKDREVNFDVETAIRVCRSAGYYEHAVFLADKHDQHDSYLKTQLEDLHNYKKALEYIGRLDFEEVSPAASCVMLSK